MASPQLENGYTKIANDILKALAKYRLPGNEMQCIFVIFLYTYTWHKVAAEIRNKTFSEMTNIQPKHVSRALKSLEKKSIIIVTKNGNKTAPTYRFNKDFEKWEMFPKMGTNTDQDFESIINSCNPDIFVPKIGNKKEENVPKNGNNLFPKLGTSIPKIGNKMYPKLGTTQSPSFSIKEKKESIKETLKERADFLTKKYIEKIQPKNRSITRSISNLQKHIKKYTFENLDQAIENYFSTIDFSDDPKFRKDPANFFGVNEKPFLDFLPGTFKPIEPSTVIPMSKTTRHNMEVARRLAERISYES